MGHILATWKLKQADGSRLRIAGTAGELVIDGRRILLDDRTGPVREYENRPAAESVESLFVDSLEKDQPFISPGHEQIGVAKVLEKAHHAMEQALGSGLV